MDSNGTQKSLVILALAILALTSTGAKAQSLSNSCTSVLMTMSSCLKYITGNSSNPAASCCSALSNVVQSQPQCLCAAINSGAASSLGVTINQTRALGLPSVCNVKTPPISSCKASAPAESPAGAPNEQSEAPAADFPSGAGSKTVPSTQGSASDGSITRSSLHLLAFIFSVVSCTSVMAIF